MAAEPRPGGRLTSALAAGLFGLAMAGLVAGIARRVLGLVTAPPAAGLPFPS
ncbi:MAG TPA: hypothetical protein VHZ33_39710 [Trebonia sp.]|jgi:hypothetical protein|nr:hypothetical protein [Trebonia sp.]